MALAEHLAKATCLPGDEIVYSWRSFEAYPIIAAGAGATSVRVPEHRRATATTCAAMAAAITDRTRLILVCNPNNPTGTAVRRAELDRVPRRRAVRRAGGPGRGVPRVRHRRRRAGRRWRPTATGPTWSCCAPCPRRGAWPACGSATWSPSPRWPPRSARCVTPFSTSLVAQAAALAALDAGDEVERRCAIVVVASASGSPRRCASCRRTCRPARPTSSGCRWATGPPRSARPARRRGVIVRAVPAGDGVRVTIGTPEENDAFLAAAEAALT